MGAPAKLIHGLYPVEPIPPVDQEPRVPCKSRWIAADGGNAGCLGQGKLLTLRTRALPWRIENDRLDPLELPCQQRPSEQITGLGFDPLQAFCMAPCRVQSVERIRVSFDGEKLRPARTVAARTSRTRRRDRRSKPRRQPLVGRLRPALALRAMSPEGTRPVGEERALFP